MIQSRLHYNYKHAIYLFLKIEEVPKENIYPQVYKTWSGTSKMPQFC